MNIVHFGGYMIIDIDKHILTEGRKIALEKGLEKINIREVAKKCNVSIGTIYNYYPSKGHLIMSIVSNFWHEAFMKIDKKLSNENNFFDGIAIIFELLRKNLKDYKKDFLIRMSTLSEKDKILGREKEDNFMGFLEKKIIFLLDRDKDLTLKNFNKGDFSKFVLDNLIIRAKKNENNIDFFIEILKEILK